MTIERPVETLRLGAQELSDLVNELERDGAASRGSKRASRRWRAQHQKIAVTVFEEGTRKRTFAMVPRNISTGGMGLLHGAYMHPGAECVIALRDVRGRAVQVRGRVVRCTHLRGTVHDLGVQFAERVNPREFFIWAGTEYLFNAERVDPKAIKGRMLIVDDSRSDQRLISHLLKETCLEFEFADTGEEGLKMLSATPGPSFALVDYVLPDFDGITLVTRARAAGCTTPMVLISGTAEQDTRYAAIAAGAKEMLFKPLSEALMLRAAAEYLLYTDIQKRDEDPHAAGASGMSAEAVEACVQEIRQLGERLASLLAASAFEKVGDVVGRLEGMAADYGFKALRTHSGAAGKKLRVGEAAANELGKVVEACRLARAGK
ncbi:MAG: response regulator [Phycisphaerales bacterium]